MPTVLRSAAFRFWINTDDHDPAHVHVSNGDGEAKIRLSYDGQAVKIMNAWAMRDRDVAKARAIVVEHNAMLLARWREIHEQ